jgi:uncharacterized protein (DUF2062 family)
MFEKRKIINFFKKIMNTEASPQKMAGSFAIGVYLAFLPLPGLHTVMMFFLKWLFSLNFPVLFIATSINNPWTLIPFYSADYFFGYWLIHNFFGCNPDYYISLEKVFGSGKFCVISFLIGGNVLGIAAALLSYPTVCILFKKFSKNGKADL